LRCRSQAVQRTLFETCTAPLDAGPGPAPTARLLAAERDPTATDNDKLVGGYERRSKSRTALMRQIRSAWGGGINAMFLSGRRVLILLPNTLLITLPHASAREYPVAVVTDMVEIRRLGSAKKDENLGFRRYLSAHHHRVEELQSLAAQIQPQIDCTTCANCCRCGVVEVHRGDVEALARHVGGSFEEATGAYTRLDPENPGTRVLKILGRRRSKPSKRFWRCLPAATTAASSSARRSLGMVSESKIVIGANHDFRIAGCPFNRDAGSAPRPRFLPEAQNQPAEG
jgi:hypothetical protein